jgi:hypothetical protein
MPAAAPCRAREAVAVELTMCILPFGRRPASGREELSLCYLSSRVKRVGVTLFSDGSYYTFGWVEMPASCSLYG